MAGVAIAGGWWILLALNNVATRLLFVVGFRYNRSTAERSPGNAAKPADAGTALPDLARLRDGGLISADEYASKRAKILERL